MAEKESALNDEINSLKLQLSESRLQIQSLREELSRKTKLVTSLKAARQAESTAADHWRVEAQAGEDNMKRFSRAVASKDAIIKDLRAKLEAQAEEAERDAANQPQYSAIDAAPPADFKARLKAAETERLRMRSRLSVMRDRLTEAESDIKELKDENMKLAKSSEMCETLRNSLARKEAQIRSIKSRLDAQQSESQEALQESEKRIK
jgi:chromosome segregation ATPase